MPVQSFFSIVIPTKNRPGYLKESIESVLLQDFEDYELIVSDNYNESSTEDVLQQFSDHPKFTSYRTAQELNMIDHWEFATQKATGKYVLVLADRKVLFNGSLKRMKTDIEKHPSINAFSFGVCAFDETTMSILPSDKFSKVVEILDSADLIHNFLRENIYQQSSLDAKFPKTLNGVYRNDYAAEIREKYGTYFNNDGVTTPDFSSLFVNLSLNETVGHLGYPVLLVQGEGVSNGRNFGNGKVNNYLASLKLKEPFSTVPIKGPFIFNLLYSDYEVICHKFKGNLEHAPLDWVNYFATCKYELNRKLELTELDMAVKEKFTNYWQAAFDALESELKKEILGLEKKYELDLYNWNQGIRKKTFFDYLSIAKSKLKTLPILKSLYNKQYASGLQAANFDLK